MNYTSFLKNKSNKHSENLFFTMTIALNKGLSISIFEI